MHFSHIRSLDILLSALLLLQTHALLTKVSGLKVWTAWSPCSATCGQGISTRHCQDGDTRVPRTYSATCSGANTQVKVCSLQPCPSDQTSTRQIYCSLYNSRRFAGRQYLWEPFVHPSDPCKLACRAKGQHFYANLPDKAENGTTCKLDTALTAICVNGVCKPVGCDGVVESAAVKDVCGVCKGDGSSCQTISGIFTSTDLKPGVNYVISIPGGSTKISITELRASENFLILQTVDGRYIINGETNSSSFSVVEAAGTIFKHEAKVSPHSKESITSPGPTNITLVLKILIKDSNPGILYSFSVPRDVGSAVIQQIRQRSRPSEISSESEKYPDDPGTSSSDRNSSQIRHESKHNLIDRPVLPRRSKLTQNHHLNKTEPHTKSDFKTMVYNSSLTSNTETSELNIYESPSTKQAITTIKNAPVILSSKVNLNLEDTERKEEYLQITRNSSRFDASKMSKSEQLPTDEHILQNEKHNFLFDNINRTKLLSDVAVKNVYDLYLNKSIGFENKDSYPRKARWPDFVLDKEQEDNRNTNSTSSIIEAEHISHFATTLSDSNHTIVDSVLVDRQANFANSSSKPLDDILQITTHSEKVSSNRLIDTDVTGKLNPNDDNYSKFNFNKRRNEYTANIYGKENQAPIYGNKENISESLNEENISNHKQNGAFPTDTYNLSIFSDINENSDRIKAIKADSQPTDATDSSRYMVPRYSQSFRFPHKYTDHLGGREQPRVINNRQQHNHNARNFNVSREISLENEQEDKQTWKSYSSELDSEDIQPRKSSSNTIDYEDSRSSQSMSLTTSSTDATSLSTTVSYINDTLQHSVLNFYQTIEKISKDRRLHIRNTVVDHRKRRLEEQRRLYNERIKEIRNIFRQKQAERENSRRAGLKHGDTKIINNSNSSGVSLQRNTELLNSVSFQTSQTTDYTIPTSTPNDDLSLTHSQTNPFHSENSDYDEVKLGYHEIPAKVSEDLSLAPPTLVNLHTETTTQTSDFVLSGADYTSTTNSHKDLNTRRQLVQRKHIHFNNMYTSENSAGNVNVETRIQDTPSGFQSHHKEPRIALTPLVETFNTLTGNNKQYANSQISIGSEQNREEHLIDQPESHGTEEFLQITSIFPYIPLMSRNSNNEPARERFEGPNIVEILDISGQTSLNTHSLVYEWRVSGLTQCTHSCGGGIQQTVVVCVDTITQAVVTDENCRQFMRPKLLAVPCNTRPCSAEWVPGAWSSCTVSCGTGEQTRIVSCQARVSPTLNMTMPSSSCESKDRIPDRQTCSNRPCSSWKVGAWSNCSTSCGHKSRNISCVDLTGHILSDHSCTEIKPHSQEPCNLGECGHGWFFTEWNKECSSECGEGVIKRQVFCADKLASRLPDNRCDVNQRPPDTHICHASQHCGALWYAGHWSKCDVKCGPGSRRRHVICVQEISANVFAATGEDNCTDVNKPAMVEPCQLSPCASEWYMTSWSPCSKACDTGSRTREIRCLDQDHNVADDCLLQTRPKSREPCNTHSCSSAIIEDKLPDCTDKFTQCSVVKRARLCRYNYYRRMCCQSCAEFM